MISILILRISPNGKVIADLSGIHAYMIAKYLSKDKYALTIKSMMMTIDEYAALDEYDYCVVTAIRGMTKIPKDKKQVLRSKIKNKIITLCENNGTMGGEDILFHMVGSPRRGCIKVFWGADLSLLKPNKNPDKIVILVDHQYYGKRSSNIWKKDRTAVIIESLLEYQKTHPEIVIKQICTGNVRTIKDKYTLPKTYGRTSVDFRTLYKYYCEADIFVPTHPESFGFSNVECAGAGALIAYPSPGYLNRVITSTLLSVSLGDCTSINWGDIIAKRNVNKSIEMAKLFSYENIAMEIEKVVTEKKD